MDNATAELFARHGALGTPATFADDALLALEREADEQAARRALLDAVRERRRPEPPEGPPRDRSPSLSNEDVLPRSSADEEEEEEDEEAAPSSSSSSPRAHAHQEQPREELEPRRHCLLTASPGAQETEEAERRGKSELEAEESESESESCPRRGRCGVVQALLALLVFALVLGDSLFAALIHGRERPHFWARRTLRGRLVVNLATTQCVAEGHEFTVAPGLDSFDEQFLDEHWGGENEDEDADKDKKQHDGRGGDSTLEYSPPTLAGLLLTHAPAVKQLSHTAGAAVAAVPRFVARRVHVMRVRL